MTWRFLRRTLVPTSLVALAIQPAGAAAPGGFNLVARADVMAVQMISSQAPVVPGGEVVYATPASAQAGADSLGSSRAFASAPYAGDFFTTLPGTINGLGAGQFPPLPTFPFYVSSEHPSRPKEEFTAASYRVRATSAEAASAGDSRVGASTAAPEAAAGMALASVSRDAGNGILVAEATSELQPLALSDDVRIGEVRSVVRLRYDPAAPDAAVVKKSSFHIGTITVAGMELGLTEQGLTMAGNPVVPVDLSAVTEHLRQAGVDLEYVPAVETPTSLTSASARISFVREQAGFGLNRITLVLGQVSALVDPSSPRPSNPAVDLPADFLAPTPIDEFLPGTGVAPPGGAGGGAFVPGLGPAPATSGPGVAGPATVDEVPSAAPSEVASAAPPAPAPSATAAAAEMPPLADTARIYPVLALAGLVALAASRLPARRRR